MKRKIFAISLHRKQYAIIVRALFQSVEELFDRAHLPAVEVLRPSSCPLCGQLAFVPGEQPGIVGHGTYRRQVLGVAV